MYSGLIQRIAASVLILAMESQKVSLPMSSASIRQLHSLGLISPGEPLKDKEIVVPPVSRCAPRLTGMCRLTNASCPLTNVSSGVCVSSIRVVCWGSSRLSLRWCTISRVFSARSLVQLRRGPGTCYRTQTSSSVRPSVGSHRIRTWSTNPVARTSARSGSVRCVSQTRSSFSVSERTHQAPRAVRELELDCACDSHTVVPFVLLALQDKVEPLHDLFDKDGVATPHSTDPANKLHPYGPLPTMMFILSASDLVERGKFGDDDLEQLSQGEAVRTHATRKPRAREFNHDTDVCVLASVRNVCACA